jgi:hypothetical protein
MRRATSSLFGIVGLLFLGCGGEALPLERPRVVVGEVVGERSEELRIALGPRGIATDFSTQSEFTFGVAGDTRVVFVTKPLDKKITVLDRFTGKFIADIPGPPGGWGFPFKLRVPEDGHLVVLDPGGFGGPEIPIPKVYDVQYSYGKKKFTSSISRTISFEGLPVPFVEDVEVLANGTYVVSEPIIGSIWTISPGGTLTPAVFPLIPFDPAHSIPQLAACPFVGSLVVDGIPVAPAGGIAPGINPLASRNGILYFAGTCTGGIHKIPLATLFDGTRTPDQRAADIAPVSPRAPGTLEAFEGIAFNPARPNDPWLYAGDCFNLRILRVNINTGVRQLVVGDRTLFNFPTGLQFLPPVLGVAPLMVASDQQHRWATFNTNLSQDQFEPWVMAKVLPFD